RYATLFRSVVARGSDGCAVQEGEDCIGGLAVAVGHHVRVDVSGERIAAVPERVGDDLHVRPRGQCEARGAVSKVVEPERWQTSLVSQVEEEVPQGVSGDPFAPPMCEDQTTLCYQHTTH